MVNITLSIPESVHSEELFATFSPKEQAAFQKISEKKQKKLFKRLEREEWKHKKFLM